MIRKFQLYKKRYCIAKKKQKNERNLKKLIRNSEEIYKEVGKKVNILFAPGFNINPSLTNHDVIIASLLHSKGAEICYTAGIGRLTNSVFYGGAWSGGGRLKEIESVKERDGRAIGFFRKIGSIFDMSDMVNSKESEEIKEQVFDMKISDLTSFTYENMMLGRDAIGRVRNQNLVSDINLIHDFEGQLKEALVNCIIYSKFFKRAVDKFKPDSIFSHDSFYYPWSIMQKIANNYKIPFYNYYCAMRQDAFIYANNEHAMKLDMEELWGQVKDISLGSEKTECVYSLLEDRKRGNTGMLKQNRYYDSNYRNNIISFAKKKPTAVLYGNVVWDLMALDKEVIFDNIREAYVKTIEYFISHQELQLIIKSHPDEENPRIPTTVERLKTIVAEKFKELPDNVRLLESKTFVTAYDLFEISKCSLVYTTTTGIESAISGVPVITLANAHYRNKGFTYDPGDSVEYFKILEKLLKSGEEPHLKNEHSHLGTKYFYYLYFVLLYNYGIPSFSYYKNESPILKHSPEEYLENKRLESVINAIIHGQRIKIKL